MLGLSLMGPKVIKETISCLPCSTSTDLKGPKWLGEGGGEIHLSQFVPSLLYGNHKKA